MNNTIRRIDSPTLYDDVFRTMITDSDLLAVKLANEMFGENISEDAKCIRLQNEVFLADNEKRILDSHLGFSGNEYIFHMECEAVAGDAGILVRLFEYDSSVALSHHTLEQDKLYVTFPKTGVLYLRDSKNTPDRMQMIVNAPSSEHPLVVDVPVMKMSSYTSDEIISKKLWFLFPFYIFNLEAWLNSKEMERVSQAEDDVLDYLERITKELDDLIGSGEIDSYLRELLKQMIIKATGEVARKSDRIRKGVSAMGGRVLDYEAKDILNRGKEIGRAAGREEGREEGIEIGHEIGREQCNVNAIKTAIDLCKSLGGSAVDAIEKVVANMGISQADAEAMVAKYW